ncbi:peptidase M16-like protein [unidentified eubacterium SCB49]|nr:peptidase M16-like protein [unidentified eubacterium SCB49]
MKKYILYTFALVLTGLTATAQIDRTKMPTSGPTPEVNLGNADEFTLKNGLTVLVVNDTKLPSVTFSLNLNNPTAFEGDKAGVQSLTGALLGKETMKTSKDDFSEQVDFLGARINVTPNGGFGFCLSKYTDEVFSLFAEAALSPKFTQKELDFEKEQLITNIKSGEKSAAAIAGNVRNALAYGKNHAAGEITTEATINNVTLEDVQSFYNDRFKPSRGYMVFTGDITTKEVKKLLKKYMSDWKAGEATTPSYPVTSDVASTEINFVDVPNAVQTELAIINMVPLKMKDKDYHAALIANYIFGGGFGSYLNMNLREANGYTYGARSAIRTGKDYDATFIVTTKIRNAVTDSAVVESLKEMNRVRTTTVDAETLKNAKAKFLGSFILESEDKAVVARRTINIKTNDLPADFYKNFIANINAVTQDDIKRVANKYFKIDKARIVLVGKGTDVIDGIENIVWEGKKIPVKYFDKEANPTEKPSTVAIPEGVNANTVMANYIKAIGGTEAAASVNSITFVGEAEMQGMKFQLESKNTSKGQSSNVLSMGGNPMQTTIFNGTEGYTSARGQKIPNTPEQNKMAKEGAVPFPELNPSEMTLEGIEPVDGKNAYVLSTGDAKVFYDAETGLKVKSTITMSQGGQTMTMGTSYSDYKTVNGVKVPHTVTMAMGPQELKFVASKVLVNEGVTDADFE